MHNHNLVLRNHAKNLLVSNPNIIEEEKVESQDLEKINAEE